MIGRRIGHCDVLRRLGEGGMGQVFAGIDRSLDRPVAIKALRPEYSREPAFVTRFRAEAGAMARLSHPNIASIYSLERAGDQQFMVLELVQGLTLQDLLVQHGPLDEIGTLAMAAQALAGLAAAHAQGIVHRDLKPANLMITAAGAVKLMDFGIARVGGAERLTRLGHMVGTSAYMAPEQIRGEAGEVRSDLYSLGLVLYETLIGRSPFAAKNDYEYFEAQLNQQPAPLRDRLPALSDGFHDAVMRCLAKDPARRFDSAEAFGRALGVHALAGMAQEILRDRVGAPIARALAPPPSAAPIAPRPATAFTGLKPLGSVTAMPSRAPLPSRAARSGGHPLFVLGAALASTLALLASMLLPWAGGRTPAHLVARPTLTQPMGTPDFPLLQLEESELDYWHGEPDGPHPVPEATASVAMPVPPAEEPAATPSVVPPAVAAEPPPIVAIPVRRAFGPASGGAAAAVTTGPGPRASGNEDASGWVIRD